jgi:hypothetical protein
MVGDFIVNLKREFKYNNHLNFLTGGLKAMIKVLLSSSNGHEELHLSNAEAVDFIKDQCANKGKWAYLDKDYANPNSIDEKSIRGVKEVMLVNQVAGG